MFAIQPLSLPSAAQMLLAIDAAGEPATEAGFEAQFSALLASAGPAATPPIAANAPARPALPGARGGKEEAASGKLPGKQSGNILPDALAALVAPPGNGDAAPSAAEISPEAAPDATPSDPAPAPATLTVQRVLAQISVPTVSSAAAAPPRALAAPAAAAAPALSSAAAVAPADARPSRWFAMASTAPATATSATPGVPVSGAALPPMLINPVPAGQTASAALQPDAPAQAPPRAAIPAVRFLLALPTGLKSLRSLGEAALPGEAFTPLVKAEPPAATAPVVLQLLGQAQAASFALAHQSAKLADPAAPPVPLEAPAVQLEAKLAAAGLEALAAAPQPTAGAAAVPAAMTATGTSPAATQPHDFAALIDRLVEARQAVQSSLTSQTVQASVQHTEFGRVSLSFQQDPTGMTVSFANPDPDLARAVQNLQPMALPADIRPAATGAPAQRQDGQGGGAATSGQQQGQSQGQLSAQQQRGQSPQREPASGSVAQDRQAGNDADSPSDPRGGIFA